MTTNTSAADAMNFTLDSGLDKETLAQLLPSEARAVLNAAPEYNKACGRIWLPLFRSSQRAA
jgi:hypothetical protein